MGFTVNIEGSLPSDSCVSIGPLIVSRLIKLFIEFCPVEGVGVMVKIGVFVLFFLIFYHLGECSQIRCNQSSLVTFLGGSASAVISLSVGLGEDSSCSVGLGSLQGALRVSLGGAEC